MPLKFAARLWANARSSQKSRAHGSPPHGNHLAPAPDTRRTMAEAPPALDHRHRSPTPEGRNSNDHRALTPKELPTSRREGRSSAPEGLPMPGSDHRAPAPKGLPTSRRAPEGLPTTAVALRGLPSIRIDDSRRTAHSDAVRLLHHLQFELLLSGDVLFAEVVGYYRLFCAHQGWNPLAWNPVGRELRALLGGHKTYSWRYEGEELPHRRRVYRLPPRR